MRWSDLNVQVLPVLFVGTVIIILLSFQGGVKLGRWRRQQPDPDPPLPTRVMVTSIFSLLAFMMGFGFGLASSHSDSRNQALADEAIAIGMAYRRADLLSEPTRSSLRSSIMKYVDLRLEAARSRNVAAAIPKLRHLQQRMWAQAIEGGSNDAAPPALLLQSLNDVIDVHGERVLSNMRSRISLGVWSVLYMMLVLAVVAAGFHHGLMGGRRSVSAMIYSLVFALVMTMIADLDVPRLGRFEVSHQVLIDLQERLAQTQ